MTIRNKNSDPLLCDQIQKYLIEIQDNGRQPNLPTQFGDHMSTCQDCQMFAYHVKVVKDSVKFYNKNRIKPYPFILSRLLSYINKDAQKKSSIIQKIEMLLNYPVPVYKVLTGLMLIAALTAGLKMFSGTTKESINSAETFYLADSTHKLFLSKGKTVYEDTVWARYMVTF